MLKKIIQARIALRLPALIIGAILLAEVALSVLFTSKFSEAMNHQTEQRTKLVAENLKSELAAWQKMVQVEFNILRDLPEVASAMTRLTQSMSSMTPSDLAAVRTAYTDANPAPQGQKAELDFAADGSAYSSIHAQIHPILRKIMTQTGFHDIFLIDTNGLVVYTVAKEADFGISLASGAYAETGLARAFSRALAGSGDTPVFEDYSSYPASGNAPASFIAQKVTGPSGTVLGVLAIQLPSDVIGKLVGDTNGLTDLDEVYLVGMDGLARTVARQDGLLSILSPLDNSPQLQSAISEAEAYLPSVTGLRGNAAVAYVASIDVFGTQWAAVVELDHANAFANLYNMTRWASITVAVGAVLALVVGFLVARSITAPIAAFSTAMKRVSDDDFETVIPGLDRHDEIGGLSRILDDFRQRLASLRAADERQDAVRAEQTQVVEVLGRSLHALAAGNLGSRIDQQFPADYEALRLSFNATTDALSELVTAIAANAGEIKTRAEEISMSSDSLSHRTESQAATLEETAAALDELTASVRSAADSASEVERVVNDARSHAEKSGRVVADAVSAMSQIKQSSDEISQIIGVIDDIAFQTNLLALNAGVEAARAGDAGRGFAVVASEVRALAQRSSDAAKQIKTLIGGSTEQVETGVGLVGNAGEALTSIVAQVGQIANLVSNIATGAREQSSGLGEINIGVTQLDQVTQQNAAMVEESTAAAASLRGEAEALTSLVAHFKVEVAAGQERVVPMKRAMPTEIRKAIPEVELPVRASGLSAASGQWKDF